MNPHVFTLSTLLTEPSAQNLFVRSFYNSIVNTNLPLLILTQKYNDRYPTLHITLPNKAVKCTNRNSYLKKNKPL